MSWTLSDSVEEFRAAAGTLVDAHPAENTVLLSVSQRIADAGPRAFGPQPARFGWWREDESEPVAGAFLETPPYPVRLSIMPEKAAAELAYLLGDSTTSVGGWRAAVDSFVDAWTSATGGTSSVQMNQRLYRLGELTIPPVPGDARLATTGDRGLVIQWWNAFADEVGGPHGDTEGAVDSRLLSGAVWLWEDRGDTVSMAGASPVIAEMSRVGPVYTPPEHRGHGFASAVTAAASVDALARGAAQVLLYTDLANPTSNSIYQQIGYRPVADEVIVDLHR
jgi:predicted GNAT family acetyltransferase